MWKEIVETQLESRPIAPDTARLMRASAWAVTRRAMAEAGDSAVDVQDLDPEGMIGWSSAQWARARRSGLLERLPKAIWPGFDEEDEEDSAQAPWQASTSSTFPEDEDE